MAMRWLPRLLLAAVLGWVLQRTLSPMAEHDLFFHLKLGDVILAHHKIPFRNLFSFTYPDAPDLDMSWAFQVLVALLYRVGGFAAIVLGKAALIVAAAALVYQAARRGGAGPLSAALATLVAVAAAEPRLCERPHLVTFVGISALLLLLAEVERGRRHLLWLAPPLVLVWAQFHAGVFFAPLILLSYGAGALADHALPDRSRFVAVLVGCAACAIATPAGLRLLPYLGWHTGLSATRTVDEFRHADGWNDPLFFVLLAAALASAFALVRARRLRHALPVLVVAPLAWRSVRFVAEWSFLAAPLVAAGLHELARVLPVRAHLRRPRAALAAAALALAGLTALERAGRPLQIGLADDVVPFAAIEFATRTGLRERMYSDFDVGCYLLWEGYPRYRVFQDARLPAYPDAFHRALDQTPLEPAAWDALLRRYDVDAALIAYPGVNIRAGSFDPDEWALLWRTRDALVFARRTPAHESVIAEHEIPLRVRFAYDRGSWVEPLALAPARAPIARCEWDRRLAAALYAEADPDRALDARAQALAHGCLSPNEEADLRFHLGARLQARGQLRGALSEYDRALALRPDDVFTLANRGFARLPFDPAAARADLERALALDPSRADVREGLRRVRSASHPAAADRSSR